MMALFSLFSYSFSPTKRTEVVTILLCYYINCAISARVQAFEIEPYFLREGAMSLHGRLPSYYLALSWLLTKICYLIEKEVIV